MVKKLLTVPNPKLNLKSKEVACIDKKVRRLLANLKDTIATQKDPEGAGLAAVQIGFNKRVFVMKRKTDFVAIVNPRILRKSTKTNFTEVSKEEIVPEGCLSVPGIYDLVERSWEIKVSYRDENFNKIEEALTGLEAEIFQHEVDHLDGILFTQRALESKSSENYPSRN